MRCNTRFRLLGGRGISKPLKRCVVQDTGQAGFGGKKTLNHVRLPRQRQKKFNFLFEEESKQDTRVAYDSLISLLAHLELQLSHSKSSEKKTQLCVLLLLLKSQSERGSFVSHTKSFAFVRETLRRKHLRLRVYVVTTYILSFSTLARVKCVPFETILPALTTRSVETVDLSSDGLPECDGDLRRGVGRRQQPIGA